MTFVDTRKRGTNICVFIMLSNMHVMMRKAWAKICQIIQQSKSEAKNLKNIFNVLLESCFSFSILPGLILTNSFF